MGLLKKIFGICDTKQPSDPDAWKIDGSSITLDLSRFPELGVSGGAVRLEGKGLSKRVFVIRGEGDDFFAYENRCTHMGRRLDPGSNAGTVKCCSVSGSVFAMKGDPVAGPAKHSLNCFSVRTEGDFLKVNIS